MAQQLVSLTRRTTMYAGSTRLVGAYLDLSFRGSLRLVLAHSKEIDFEDFVPNPSSVNSFTMTKEVREDIGSVPVVNLLIQFKGGGGSSGAKLGDMRVTSGEPGLQVIRPIEVEADGKRYIGSPAQFVVKEGGLSGAKLAWKPVT